MAGRWQDGGRTALPLPAAGLLTLAGVAVVLAVAVQTARAGRRLPADGGGARDRHAPVMRDDDRFWIGGLIYRNRDAPAVLVERRFGVGVTLNLGNVRSWLLLAAVAGLLVALVAIHRWGCRTGRLPAGPWPP